MGIVYTIGYSCFPIDKFLATLIEHGITVLVDVRSQPHTGHFPDYNKEILTNVLKQHGIIYRNYAREFGARQEDRRFFSLEGYLDFELFAASEVFDEGVKKVQAGINMGFTFCLMCAEKDPIHCHRAIMITREFAKRGFDIVHLMPNKQAKSQADIETELLDLYFPNRAQISLFQLPEDELISLAYRKQNAVIGYRIGEEEIHETIHDGLYSENS